MRIVYISHGNIPSKWAHSFQVMKMAEALSSIAGGFELLTSGSIARSASDDVDIWEWYGIARPFVVRTLRVYRRRKERFSRAVRLPRFEKAAALYARIVSPDLVFTRSPRAADMCAWLGLRTILETHVLPGNPVFEHVLGAVSRRRLIGLVTVTDALKQQYVTAGISGDNVLVWPDAVDVERFSSAPERDAIREELGLPQDDTICTYCGHLYAEKGIGTLIAAARRAPDLQFVVVGGWPEDEARCRDQTMGLENIRFVGFVANRDVPRWLAASDFLILPNSARYSHAEVTSPMKLFEYMAAQRPVIASAVPAFDGVLSHKVNSWLVEPDSPDALVAGIRALRGNPQMARRLREKAWGEVQGLTWAHRARAILAHFDVPVGRA